MQIKKILSRLFICVLCIGCFYTSPVSALRSAAPVGDVNEGGDWIGGDNIEKFHQQIDSDIEKVQQQFEQDIQSDSFVPIEAKLGLAFMYAVSGTSNGIFGNSTQNGTSFIDFVISVSTS